MICQCVMCYVYVHILVMVFCSLVFLRKMLESEKNDNLPVSRWDRIFHVTVLKRAILLQADPIITVTPLQIFLKCG